MTGSKWLLTLFSVWLYGEEEGGRDTDGGRSHPVMTTVTVVRKIRRERWSERKRLAERRQRKLNAYNDREGKKGIPQPQE